LLANVPPSPRLERAGGKFTGRLFDDDPWVREAMRATPPCFGAVSQELAQYGVTGVTDMSASNGLAIAAHFADQSRSGHLLQKVVIAGGLDLIDSDFHGRLGLGPAKLHLHEWALPELDATVDFVRTAHDQDRAVAVHCTTEVELVFALAALRCAGQSEGDRIEHAGIASDALIEDIAALGLSVVSQPHFIAERGDQYLRDVARDDHLLLYRLAAFKDAHVDLAGGSDGPYGGLDPWAAMRAAMSRTTTAGFVIGAGEALNRDAALALYLADPHDLGSVRTVTPGAPADLCLLHRPWAQSQIDADAVRMTIIDGGCVYDGSSKSIVTAPHRSGDFAR
jgi:Amidohydrolase family